jgi:hypothetical protein
VLGVGAAGAGFAFLVPGVAVEFVGVDVVGVVDVAVPVVGVVAVGVLAVGVDAVLGGAVPVAGSVLGGLVIVLTCDVSLETAMNAAATPPRASRKITVTTMIGMRQLPGGRMRVVAA